MKAKQEGRQGETGPWEGVCRRVSAFQHWHTCGETMGDKRGQGETRAGCSIQHKHKCGETMEDNGRQAKKRPREGRRTIQHWHTCGVTMGAKRRQGLGTADTPSNKETRRERKGDKTSGRTHHYSLSNTGAHVRTMGDNGREAGGRPQEGGEAIQREPRRRQWETSGRRTHHPPPRMWGDKGGGIER